MFPQHLQLSDDTFGSHSLFVIQLYLEIPSKGNKGGYLVGETTLLTYNNKDIYIHVYIYMYIIQRYLYTYIYTHIHLLLYTYTLDIKYT